MTGSKRTVEISEETFQFLKELACRIDTQDNRATAKPYFFVIKQPRLYPCHEDYGGCDKYVRIEQDDHRQFDDTDEGRTEYFNFLRRNTDEKLSDDECLESWDKLEVVPMEERDEEDNCFLTFQAYEDHVRRNKHNLGKHHSYLKHAFRNAEMEGLFTAIAEFKDL